jgi:uncharacterized protein (UPF0218 family)
MKSKYTENYLESLFENGKPLIITLKSIKSLSATHGKIYSGEEFIKLISSKDNYLITVGDMVTITAINGGIKPNLAIFDTKTRRKHINYSVITQAYNSIETVKNKKGEITLALYITLLSGIKKNGTAVRVIGEEDLAAPLCIAISKKGTLIAWGVPGKGINIIQVNERTKRHAINILNEMKSNGY